MSYGDGRMILAKSVLCKFTLNECEYHTKLYTHYKIRACGTVSHSNVFTEEIQKYLSHLKRRNSRFQLVGISPGSIHCDRFF